VPSGSRLLGSSTQPVPDAWMASGAGDDGTVRMTDGSAGTGELSVFQVVGFGERRETTFRYQLPAAVLARDDQGWHYRLRVQKQAGINAIPLAVNVRLPPRAALVAAAPGPAAQTGGSLAECPSARRSSSPFSSA